MTDSSTTIIIILRSPNFFNFFDFTLFAGFLLFTEMDSRVGDRFNLQNVQSKLGHFDHKTGGFFYATCGLIIISYDYNLLGNLTTRK